MQHPNVLVLTLYGRHGCHLCAVMQQQLAPLQAEYGFEINPIDIDTDSTLAVRYNTLIPVLAAGETELCHYHLDEAAVRAFLQQAMQ